MRFIAMSVLTTVCAFGVFAQESAENEQGGSEIEVVQAEPVSEMVGDSE